MNLNSTIRGYVVSMSEVLRSQVNLAIDAVFGVDRRVSGIRDVGLGRGVFSTVVQVGFENGESVVVKLPLAGPNGDAARASGAYQREVLAYTTILDEGTPLRFPACYGTHETPYGPAVVMEDLSPLTAVDQLDGLTEPLLQRVAVSLGAFHKHFLDHPRLHDLDVRRHTPARFDASALSSGLNHVAETSRSVFAALLERRADLVDAFVGLSDQTLTHGDPRADNLVFSGPNGSGDPVFFDWQQLAIQAGEADLAWLLATSATPAVRRASERSICSVYADATGKSTAEVWRRYRLSMLLPGLAVLLLAQRETQTDRASRMVAVSLERISAAVADVLLAD